VKQYFLSGKLPDWGKMRDWDNSERHVDLFMFIWLHPSWNEGVLLELRNAYVKSNLIILEDITAGFGNFLRWSTGMACQDYTDADEEEMQHALITDEHNELIFKILLGDLANRPGVLQQRNVLDEPIQIKYGFPEFCFGHIQEMGNWLAIKEMCPLNDDMLFQYDLPLEWWFDCSMRDKRAVESVTSDVNRPYVERAMYRIHHFETGAEGDTRRSRFAHKIRKILDEGQFISEIREMWEDVKAGKIVVEKPWED
jgi:hypothetical protein